MFKIEKKKRSSAVVVKEGSLTSTRNKKRVVNEVGINLTFDTEGQTLDGKILFHLVNTGIKTEQELFKVLEEVINTSFKTDIPEE